MTSFAGAPSRRGEIATIVILVLATLIVAVLPMSW